MSTFRGIALKLVEEARDDLARDGLLDDRAGALAGAMVDAATIAVQEWLRSESVPESARVIGVLIRQAGKVAQ